jgi:hypothetical protein
MHSLARKKLLLVTFSVMILSSLVFAPKARSIGPGDLIDIEITVAGSHLSPQCLSLNEEIKNYKERIEKLERYFRINQRSILFSGLSFKDKFLSEYYKWLVAKLAKLEDEFKAQCENDSSFSLPTFP